MIGYYPSYFFVGCWAVVTPAICAGIFFFKVSSESVQPSLASNPPWFVAARHLGEPGLPGVPLPLVGSRCWILHGGQLHALHPGLRHLALGHHAGNMERGQTSPSINITERY